MDAESLGGGAGAGGIVAIILSILGINRKQDKGTCGATHKAVDEKFETLIEMHKEMQKDIKDGQKQIWERLDDLNDYMRDRRKGYD